MNSKCMESSVGLDRLATQDEVRSAMSFSSPAALEFVGLRDDFTAMDPDSSGHAAKLCEEIEWLMIVGEMRDSISN
jgi:hypothetical protein